MDVHRCRFVKYEPKSIHALKFSHSSNLSGPSNPHLRAAVGRANGDIEIWRPRNNWCHDITIRGGESRSIEGICWTQSESGALRLFSIGYSSFVTEWDLSSQKPAVNRDCNAGSIWSISASPNQKFLAVGCENGSVIIFDIDGGHGYIEYVRGLGGIQSKALSLSWIDDNTIVGACADSSVRVWDLKRPGAPVIAKMQVDRRGKAHNLVWCVAVLHDGTIVAGDSCGVLRFWDADKFVLQQALRAHDADILCLTVCADGKTMFTSGVDRRLVQYTRSDDGLWSQVKWRRIHAHDVHVMDSYCSQDLDVIVTGGTDTCLAIVPAHAYMSTPHRMLHPVPQNPVMALSTGSKRAISWGDHQIRIWDFSAPSEPFCERNVLKLKMNLSTEEFLLHCAISDDGEFIAASTASCTKIFRIVLDQDGNIEAHKIHCSYIESRGAVFVEFAAQEPKLVLAHHNGDISIIDYSNWSHNEFAFFAIESDTPISTGTIGAGYVDCISALAVSPNGKYVVVSDYHKRLFCYSLETLAIVKQLPQIPSTVRKIEWRRDISSRFVCATSANGLVEYDIDTGNFSEWTQKYMTLTPRRIEKLLDRINGMFMDKRHHSRVWIWGAAFLGFIDLEMPMPIRKQHRKRKFSKLGELRVTDDPLGTDIAENHLNGFSEKFQAQEVKALLKERNGKLNRQNDEGEPVNERADTVLDADGLEITAEDSLLNGSTSQMANGILSSEPNNDQEDSEDEADDEVGATNRRRPYFVTFKYRSILFAGLLDESNMLLVERPLSDILMNKSIPPRYHKHEFGT